MDRTGSGGAPGDTPGDAFARATAVTRDDDGHWRGQVHEGWDIRGNANGGYLLAIVGRVLTSATGRPQPLTTTAHYHRPGVPGPVTIDVETVNETRRFTTATATLRRDAEPVLTVLGTLGDLGATTGPELVRATPPPMPEPDACVPLVPGDPFPPPFTGRVELRLHPEDAGFGEGRPSGEARMRGWFRLRDREPVDAVALLCAVDAFPPTIFNADLPVSWTPTIEMTAHVRARPEPGWLRCAFRTRHVAGGFLEADGEVWDGAGRLVAQSRQLALVPRAR
jgi:acyl-coenzyme A thioesterase PaaI-like protein